VQILIGWLSGLTTDVNWVLFIMGVSRKYSRWISRNIFKLLYCA